MHNKSINLPTTVSELKSAIKIAIEFYKGNPAKNENKINEALAKALGYKSYDELSPLINSCHSASRHRIFIDDNYNSFVDSQLIDESIFDEGMVKYIIRTKAEIIDDLKLHLIGAVNSNSVNPIISDLRLLNSNAFSNDEFILSSIETNHYLSQHHDAEQFNNICKEIIDLNNKIKEK